MDKNVIKKYAVWAREQLIEKVTTKAVENEIVDGQDFDENLESINGVVLTDARKKQRKALIQKIKQEGYAQVMEEVAYTWFNRFIAIRFMEVNGYLPSHVRVFSDENGDFNPQILAEAIHLDIAGLDMDHVLELKSASNDDELFKYLLIVQCNALNEVLPYMFAKIEDYTELLLPDYLLRDGSVIEKLVHEIPEDNFDINTDNGQIEIIGWMYQYYISAKHEEVVDPLHGKVVKKEEVPAATQLFTTDWVVRYLVDNSVGRYWIERNPESQLAKELTYFVTPKNGEIKYVDEKITPQDVTVFDPCVGSGHFLVYAFEVLMKIYVEYGFSERDAASEIVKNNIFGLDIDGRATQLAYFAVMMKARTYDRRFLTRNIQPNIYEITESNNADMASIEYFCGGDIKLRKDTDVLLEILKNAKEYGSILQVPQVDFGKINNRFEQINDEISIYKQYLLGNFRNLFKVVELLSRKYAIVDTNPPYLNKYDVNLKSYITDHYNDYKGDLFSVFIYRNLFCCKNNGYAAYMTPNVWMFIASYEKLRKYILENKKIDTLIQMAKGAFFKEATVDVTAFVIKNTKSTEKGKYFRLEKFKGDMEIQEKAFLEALNGLDNCSYIFNTDSSIYEKIPGCPIAYWVSDKMLEAFEGGKFFAGETKKGVLTGNNARFTRLWHEIDFTKMGINLYSHEEMILSRKKWFPVTSGGLKRKWYGNLDTVVNLENDGAEIKANVENYRLRDPQFYMLEAVTWTEVSSGLFSCRYVPKGILFGNGGPVSFFRNSNLKYHLGLLNSNTTMSVMEYLAPTVNYGPEQINKIPLIINRVSEVENLVDDCVSISKDEWDSYEVSWEFKRNPIVEIAISKDLDSIEDAFEQWSEDCACRFKKIKTNEETINTIFIETYGLCEELSPEVDDSNVTVRLADKERDIKMFVMYFVGCLMGRYSLDFPGLIFAGGQWDETRYKKYRPDVDGIIPISDDEYFNDDVVSCFIKFVETIFGKINIDNNLKFIAEAIGGKGSAREIIRNYFMNDFYADHLKMYQKRPIYWLFDSGKKNGFKCLVYMHRYQPDTIARIRTDYVHEQQARYRTAIDGIEDRIESVSGAERVKLNNKLKTLKAQDEEIHAYEEKIHHLADQMISIDLDDGVKVNYAKFQDVLAKIK